MGRIFTMTLEGKIYRCKHCGTHLAFYDDIASKVCLLFLFESGSFILFYFLKALVVLIDDFSCFPGIFGG